MKKLLVFVSSYEKRLRGDLFKDYSPTVKPVKNVSTAVYVNITLTFVQIVELVSYLLTKYSSLKNSLNYL